MGVPERLQSVIGAFPEARIVAFADMSARTVLSSAAAEDVTQEHLDRLCREAKASFDDPLEGLAVQAFGDAYGAIVIDASAVKIFLRSEVESSDALCCLCDHSIDLGPFVAKIRATLEEISADG
ncbi:MAG: hypothetical protein HC844_19125 [Tabrizicola sp.]|nr:hypothetical protein [Tabrizicola sp.]